MLKTGKILVLAPHTDDGELGCGATLSRLIREGAEVWYVAFSRCEESLPAGAPKDALVHELHAAAEVLGIPETHVTVLGYKVRNFSDSRQAILENIVRMGRDIDPDTVFCPSLHDIHQDHQVIAHECIRAFKKKNIISYELPWDNFSFENQVFFEVQKEDAYKKVAALRKYATQAGKQYTQEENILALLRTHGMQIGCEFAEVFEMPRMIVKL